MKTFRKPKDCTEHYTSLEELRKAFGLPEFTRRTKDVNKLKNQKDSFSKRHICKACGRPMTFISETNIMCCTNEKCSGIKHQTINEETGEEKVWYTTSYKALDEKGANIANIIFC